MSTIFFCFPVHDEARGRDLRQLQDDHDAAVEEERGGQDGLQRMRALLQVQRGKDYT